MISVLCSLILFLPVSESSAWEQPDRDLEIYLYVVQEPVKVMTEFPNSGLGRSQYYLVVVQVTLSTSYRIFPEGVGIGFTEPFKVQVVSTQGVNPSVPAEIWITPEMIENDHIMTRDFPVYFPISAHGQSVTIQAIADGCWGDEVFTDYCRVDEFNENNNLSETITLQLQ